MSTDEILRKCTIVQDWKSFFWIEAASFIDAGTVVGIHLYKSGMEIFLSNHVKIIKYDHFFQLKFAILSGTMSTIVVHHQTSVALTKVIAIQIVIVLVT